LDTPCLVVDLDSVERNIKTLMDDARKLGVAVRPHLKTTKSPELARKLIEAGAVGGCVAKLAEAEVMFEGGVDDLLITTELAGEPKLGRLANLAARNPRLKVVLDSEFAATQINDRLKNPAHRLKVLVDLNVGQNRCGVEDKEAALELARCINRCGNLE